MEMIRYININFQSTAISYQYDLVRLFNSFDMYGAFSNNVNIQTEMNALFGTSFTRNSQTFDLSYFDASLKSSFDWNLYFNNIIYTSSYSTTYCSEPCDGGVISNIRACRLTANMNNFGCEGFAQQSSECNIESCESVYS